MGGVFEGGWHPNAHYAFSKEKYFILFYFFWKGHEYKHYFEQVNWLSNNQKPFAVIAVKAVKTDIIHNYVPEEPIIHDYMPEEAMKPWVW